MHDIRRERHMRGRDKVVLRAAFSFLFFPDGEPLFHAQSSVLARSKGGKKKKKRKLVSCSCPAMRRGRALASNGRRACIFVALLSLAASVAAFFLDDRRLLALRYARACLFQSRENKKKSCCSNLGVGTRRKSLWLLLRAAIGWV